MNLGSTIARLRKARGLTQNELGDAAQLSTTIIAKLEHGGRSGARPKTILAIARALDSASPIDDATLAALGESSGLDLRTLLETRRASVLTRAHDAVLAASPTARRDFDVNLAISKLPALERDLCVGVLEFADEFGAEAATLMVDAMRRIADTAARRFAPSRVPEPLLTVPVSERRRPDGAVERIEHHYPVTPPPRAEKTTKRKEA